MIRVRASSTATHRKGAATSARLIDRADAAGFDPEPAALGPTGFALSRFRSGDQGQQQPEHPVIKADIHAKQDLCEGRRRQRHVAVEMHRAEDPIAGPGKPQDSARVTKQEPLHRRGRQQARPNSLHYLASAVAGFRERGNVKWRRAAALPQSTRTNKDLEAERSRPAGRPKRSASPHALRWILSTHQNSKQKFPQRRANGLFPGHLTLLLNPGHLTFGES